ncbi:hypothetical protein J4439_07345 [Candidatus Woesearchaeota archaeon]|nr:hypothetical protein [Candidatus Woesearchaeota archaeon]
MSWTLYAALFVGVFLLLLGFFPLLFYVIWTLHRGMGRKASIGEMSGKRYTLERLTEVRERSIRL